MIASGGPGLALLACLSLPAGSAVEQAHPTGFGGGPASLTLAAGDVTALEAEDLVSAIRDVLHDAIAAGGSSLRDYRQAGGELGYFQHSFAVYGREEDVCRRAGCSGEVMRIVQSGRSSFFCPVCQRG